MGVPAAAEGGAVTEKWEAVVALTVIGLEDPVIDEVTVSVAVTVWLPTVFNVTEKEPAPLVSVELAGNTACGSLLVKCTVPE